MTDDTREKLGYLNGQMDALVKKVEKIDKRTAEMEATMNKARGGWLAMLAVGGVAGTVGAFVGKLVPFLPFR